MAHRRVDGRRGQDDRSVSLRRLRALTLSRLNRLGRKMRTHALALAAASVGTLLIAAAAAATPTACQKALTKGAAALTRKTLARMARCVDKDNAGRLPGPCPDPITAAKLAIARQRIEHRVEAACGPSDPPALGFAALCSLGAPEGSAAQAACSALPVTSAGLGPCVDCWQRAGLHEFLALLYASHAVELCGGTVGLGSSVCSQGGCASMLDPIPDQRDLGRTGEADCQEGIAKAGIRYLRKRGTLLATCALAGGSRDSCLTIPKLQLKLARADAKKAATIAGACGNRRPVANASFCCRTTGNECIAAADRAACIGSGGDPQEDKSCGSDGRCRPASAGQTITWWDQCPRRSCDTYRISTIGDVAACVRDKADEAVDGVLCTRFPTRWSCPSAP
jgi:hypothetical protein